MAKTTNPVTTLPCNPVIINKDKFYQTVRSSNLFPGNKLNNEHVQNFEVILGEFTNQRLQDKRHLAYMLGTAYHETAHSMKPREEIGKGKGYDYGKMLKMGGGKGKRIEYKTPKKLYYGRGYVQLTWYENYELMGRLLNIPLLEEPELATKPEVAVKIMFEGMLKGASSFGDFTGKSLEQYFNTTTEDWVNARRIINGVDKANEIATYSKIFFKALNF